MRPAELTALAERITAHIVEEGEFELPPERVRKSGIFLDRQDSDGCAAAGSFSIRMGSHADHYLAVFGDDDGRPLHFGRTRHIASEDQRLVLIATDRGCTAPGCDRPAIATSDSCRVAT